MEWKICNKSSAMVKFMYYFRFAKTFFRFNSFRFLTIVYIVCVSLTNRLWNSFTFDMIWIHRWDSHCWLYFVIRCFKRNLDVRKLNQQWFDTTMLTDNEPIKLLRPEASLIEQRLPKNRAFVPLKWNQTRLLCLRNSN